MSIQAETIKIETPTGISQALLKLLEKKKETIILSDGKITSQEWNATLDNKW